MELAETLRAIVELTRRTGFPVPAPGDVAYRWALRRGPRLPARGRVYLYTGALYQLAPYIEASLRARERLPIKSRAVGLAARLGGAASKLLRPRRELLEWSERVVSSIALLASRAVEGLAYLYEDDLYSGVLLYDLGLDEAFAEHASKVWRRLRERGVERIVTIDPHTTHVMREAYPRYVDGYSLEVINYLEALDGEAPERGGGGTRAGSVAVHDPCLYARGAGIVEEPRRLLRASGYTVVEPARSGRDTYCCGGPVEAVAPKLSLSIAVERLRELLDTGAERIATMCPICYLNLTRAAQHLGAKVEIRDLAELVAPGGEGRG